MTTVLIILLIICLIGVPWGGGPGWHAMGYGPSGILGVMVVVLLILLLMGYV